MWSFARNSFMAPEPNNKVYSSPLIKGSYHTLIGHNTIYDHTKKFPDFINRANPSSIIVNYNTTKNMPDDNNYSPTITQKVDSNKSKMRDEAKSAEPVIDILSIRKRKKRRRRRKNKKKNCSDTNREQEDRKQQQQQNTNIIPKLRERQFSTTSEDSFIIFFDDNENDSNQCFEGEDGAEDDEEGDNGGSELDSCDSIITSPHKKVRFADKRTLCEIHPMVTWSFAYQAARKGPWEEYARDRERFRQRVNKTEAVLKDIFNADHRIKIYKERFA